MTITAPPARTSLPPGLAEAGWLWLRIGCLSFGGPAAQIAMLHREVVETRRWISEARFLHALNFCMLLPGPEAQQLATYLGWLLHGVRGGLLAGLLFILPGALVMLGLSVLYATFGNIPSVSAFFFGLQCAVLALVAEALLKVSRRALHGASAWVLAGAAFLALFVLDLPFPIVVACALLTGAALPGAFIAQPSKAGTLPGGSLIDDLLRAEPDRIGRMARQARRAGLVALVVWLWPVALLRDTGLYGDIAWFFAQMAVVTFGGAYTVLAYVAQQAVEAQGWLSAQAMMVGLGLAETTPGPLILVLQFVGFMAAWPHGLWPALGATVLTLWVTFVPSFAWIFLGAPFVERLHDRPRLRGALGAITAAVVGVIANLALWFALRLLFLERAPLRWGVVEMEWPVLASLDIPALLLSLLAGVALLVFRIGLVKVLVASALLGYALRSFAL